MKNKSVQSCQFVHHAKFHCIMTTLNKLFENHFERGELEKSPESATNSEVQFVLKVFEDIVALSSNAKRFSFFC